jgi:hypothetical protein
MEVIDLKELNRMTERMIGAPREVHWTLGPGSLD